MTSPFQYGASPTADQLETQVKATFNEALAQHQRGQSKQAQALYEAILRVQPQHYQSLYFSGMLHAQSGSFQIAANFIEKAIEVFPGNPEFHFYLGNCLQQLHKLEAAVEAYDKAIGLSPEFSQAHSNRGFALQTLGRLDAAVASYRKALAITTSDALVHCNLGAALVELQQFDAALASCDKAIALRADYAEAHFNRGNALMGRKQFGEALASYDRAIAIKPAYAKAFANRAFALLHLKQLDAALSSYDKTIGMYPGFAEAHSNRGLVLHELKRMDDALASYDRAIVTDPAYAAAYFNKSLTYLVSGSFDPGWALYEWRLKTEDSKLVRRSFVQPVWLGEEPLVGKTILLHSEQGFGDTIQFCRYATRVASLGARVIIEVPAPLLNVLGGLDGDIELVAKGKPLPTFDYHCPMLSLPLAFKTDATSIPASQSYLRSDSARMTEWGLRLGAKTKPRVGLVWSGNADHVNDHNRSIALSALVAELPDRLEYVSLQKDVRASDRLVLESNDHIRHFGDALKDFGDTAALCEWMDLVISVDTSVAHLSGALGRPTWVLLPYVPDWRWMLDRADSPWYPSVSLYRQSDDRDWVNVLEEVKANLVERYIKDSE